MPKTPSEKPKIPILEPDSLQVVLQNVEQQKSLYYSVSGKTQSAFDGTVNYLLGIIAQKERKIKELSKNKKAEKKEVP